MTRRAGNKLRGLGGEVMRQAVSEYIANCSRARLPVSRAVVASWRQVIDDSLRWEQLVTGTHRSLLDILESLEKA
jgi:hypothetical protein